eukprot:gene13581-18224_t
MSSQQCLSYVKFWLNAIAMHSHSAINGSIAPPIILIGTRKDKVPDVKDHVIRISLLLYNTFKLNIAWRSVSQNENGNSANDLINPFSNIMSESDYINKEVPLAWLQTVDKFSEMIGDQPWLSYDAAVAVAISYGVVNEEIGDMLEFLHECPTEEDPNSHFLKIHKKCFMTLPYEWNDMIEKGVVSSNLLNVLLSECSFSTLIYVVAEYLVPSIIPPMPSNLSHQKEEELNHVGYFLFTTDPKLFNHDYISISELKTKGFLPKGLFESNGQIYKDFMISYFGSQHFRLRSLPHWNCAEISTKGSNPQS